MRRGIGPAVQSMSDSATSGSHGLTCRVFRFDLQALGSGRLPGYAGSMLRGAFGHAFRRIGCLSRQVNSPCPAPKACPYHYCFETPGDASGLEQQLRPLLFEPPPPEPRDISVGATLRFGLTAIGSAGRYAPQFLAAAWEMGRQGLKVERIPFTLTRAEALRSDGSWALWFCRDEEQLRPLPPPLSLDEISRHPLNGPRAVLVFETPTRLKEDGQIVPRVELDVLLRRLRERVVRLLRAHCGIDSSTALALVTDTGSITSSVKLQWFDWRRRSNRQDRTVPMGGLVGEIELEGDLSGLAPLLRLGEVMHVGKGATMGMGRYWIKDGQPRTTDIFGGQT